MADRLRAVESRNVTHLGGAVFWDHARGANVVDVDGNRFVDVTGAFGVAAVGHANPAVVASVSHQAERLLHGMGDIHPSDVKVQLLEAIAQKAPWPETRSILGSSGSDAVEAALKTAQLATGKAGILAFEGAYHGLTLGALAATHRTHFRAPFAPRTWEGVRFLPYPTTPATLAAALDAVEATLADPMLRVGAVLVEPMQGRAGCRIPTPGFLSGLAERTNAAGAVLIADEIYTGFGRTGRWFAMEHDDCVPDLMCVGKALGGGMPISACMGRASLMDAWPESDGEAIHTSTFLGHPVAAAAALSALDVLEREDLVGRSARVGSETLRALDQVLGAADYVSEVRGLGMLLGVELSEAGYAARGGGAGVCRALLERGIIALPAGPRGEVIQLAPALNMSNELLDFVLSTLAEVVAG